VGAAAVRKQMKCTINNSNTSFDIQSSSVSTTDLSSHSRSNTSNHSLHADQLRRRIARYHKTITATNETHGMNRANRAYSHQKTETGTSLRKRNPIRPATSCKETARQFRASQKKGNRLIRAFFKFLPNEPCSLSGDASD
jgi:hypothetical protein